ncbi:MAG TPA: MoaD/ThiS family protein [Thermodesulfobacteriota bacterium]|nr:MoaD/ThiS family protein [Thermodesulfobacteriota bacterium]
MKVKINYEDHEVKPRVRLAQIVKMVRRRKKNEPMIQTIVKKTGQDHIVFVVNGRIIQPSDYDSTLLKEGDDIRWIHPFFGG